MTTSSTTTISLPSGITLLGILFVGLKLTGHISWPWVWVLAPFWIPAAIAVIFLIVLLGLWLIANSDTKY